MLTKTPRLKAHEDIAIALEVSRHLLAQLHAEPKLQDMVDVLVTSVERLADAVENLARLEADRKS